MNLFYFIKISLQNDSKFKLSHSQLNRLKSGIKNGTKATLKISSNFLSDSNNENNFLHKLLLTNTQFLKVRKSFCK